MTGVDWRGDFIHFIKDKRLPPGIDKDSPEAIRILRRSKGLVMVGDKLYKRGATSGVLMKCVSTKDRKAILREIHDGSCGNHTASRTLVGKAFRSRSY